MNGKGAGKGKHFRNFWSESKSKDPCLNLFDNHGSLYKLVIRVPRSSQALFFSCFFLGCTFHHHGITIKAPSATSPSWWTKCSGAPQSMHWSPAPQVAQGAPSCGSQKEIGLMKIWRGKRGKTNGKLLFNQKSWRDLYSTDSTKVFRSDVSNRCFRLWDPQKKIDEIWCDPCHHRTAQRPGRWCGPRSCGIRAGEPSALPRWRRARSVKPGRSVKSTGNLRKTMVFNGFSGIYLLVPGDSHRPCHWEAHPHHGYVALE